MCTRVMYTPIERQSYVGRNMDWNVPPGPSLWAFPSGVKRKARAKETGKKQFKWISVFSSVITCNYDIATSDGINSEGLTTNLLWLSKSQYPLPVTQDDKSPMSMSIWAQYLLDTCATVTDTLAAMDKIYILSANIPGREDPATCHLSVGDREGNSAIFEFINGKLITYSNIKRSDQHKNTFYYSKEAMRVMTNDPEFNQQIASLAYWNELNATPTNAPVQLPGSNLALNRFVRASYYSSHLLNNVNSTLALAGLSAVINNTAQTPVQPVGEAQNPSRTQYSTFADCENLRYIYRSNYSPFMIWINLDDLDFKDLEKGEAYHLKLNEFGFLENGNEPAHGNVTKQMVKTRSFDFIKAIVPGK